MQAKDCKNGWKASLTREEKKKARRMARWIVLGMAMTAALVLWMATWRIWEAPAVLPEESAELLAAAEGMDQISITIDFDPVNSTLSASQTMSITNRTGDPLTSLVLRSYSGAYLDEETSPAATEEWHAACYPSGFDPGGLTLQGVRVDNEIVLYSWLDDAQTVLSLPLRTTLAPGSTATVHLTYTVQIPECAGRFGHNDGIWALGNVFPTLALYENGAWRDEPVVSTGDPWLSECANWNVCLTLPEEYTVAASAYARRNAEDGIQTLTMTGHALRDFAVVISNRFVEVAEMEGDTMVAAFARTETQAREMLKYARQALRSYGKRYGDYPYPALTVCAVSFPYSAAAYPGLIMAAERYAQAGGQTLEFSVAHDIAHQWWQVIVGSDSWYEPWQHESLAEYALMDYIGDYYGADSRESAIFSQIETAMRITIPRGVTPGSPIDYFAGNAEYTQVVSLRGASLWMAMETMLGREALNQALSDYVSQHCFRIASREDLTVILEGAAGRELDALLIDYLDTNINN